MTPFFDVQICFVFEGDRFEKYRIIPIGFLGYFIVFLTNLLHGKGATTRTGFFDIGVV